MVSPTCFITLSLRNSRGLGNKQVHSHVAVPGRIGLWWCVSNEKLFHVYLGISLCGFRHSPFTNGSASRNYYYCFKTLVITCFHAIESINSLFRGFTCHSCITHTLFLALFAGRIRTPMQTSFWRLQSSWLRLGNVTLKRSIKQLGIWKYGFRTLSGGWNRGNFSWTCQSPSIPTPKR